ncbi:hypothetical protein [Rhizomicrobium electricum]|uniref:Uncharacterized protein n=1 Tax=Rhizomicrobium electricum TaxID=480070 RepID=A0ABN1EAL4_9PROT|nr:hypothetical protein [Rhizomicrobium electricum]NIJ48078.1 hypothetical protein [Rhizomicrobium electricum]
MPDSPKMLRRFGRNLLALMCGIITGTVLASGEQMWRLIGMRIANEPIETGTYTFWAIMYVGPPLSVGTVIAVIATAIWWSMGVNRRRYLFNAFGLGFVLTAIVIVVWYVAFRQQTMLNSETVASIAVYALMGAIAGAMTWFVSHPRRKNLFIALD